MDPLCKTNPADLSLTKSWSQVERRKVLSWLILVLALCASVAWFEHSRIISAGLIRGDANEYLAASYQGDLTLTGKRLFGYPLFLKVHREVCEWWAGIKDPFFWLLSAYVSQLLIYLACIYWLCQALRKVNVSVSSAILALLILHPVLSSYAALPMSDVLMTADFSLMLAALIMLLRSELRSPWYALALGLTIGIGLVLRPNFPVTAAATLFVIPLSGLLMARRSHWPASLVIRRALISVTLALIGLAPLLGIALSKCTPAYGQVCLINPYIGHMGIRISVGFGLSAPRWTGAPKMDGVMNTVDPLFTRLFTTCSNKVTFSIQDAPIRWLFACYMAAPMELPGYTVKKVVAAFDNYSVNSMTYDVTTPTEAYINRGFSLVGFLGFAFALGIFLRALWKKDAVTFGYLTPPLVFVFAQINFHVENRYFMPVYPIFFIVGLVVLLNSVKSSWAQRLAVSGMTCFFSAFFLLQTYNWDLRDCEAFHGKTATVQNSERLRSTCPSSPRTSELVEKTQRFLP